MDELTQLVKDLAKNAAIVYEGSGQENTLTVYYLPGEMPTLRASERIKVVFIREHQPQHPLFEASVRCDAGMPVPA